MPLSPSEITAVANLELYNGNRYDVSTNAKGMGGTGYQVNAGDAWNDTGTATNAVARLTTEAAASAAAALVSENNAGTSEDNAAISAAAAIAAAASADFSFVTTAGTSTAYTVNFTPDRIVGDGFAARVNFHTASGASPTLSVDGGTAYGLVDGSTVDSSGAYPDVAAARIATGATLIVLFDSLINKFIVIGLPALGDLYKVSRPPISLSTAQTFALTDDGTRQYLTGSTNRTWTIPTNAAVAFRIGAEIEVFNIGSAQLTLTADTGVTVNNVTAGSIILTPIQGGVFQKIATDTWSYMGSEMDVWA